MRLWPPPLPELIHLFPWQSSSPQTLPPSSMGATSPPSFTVTWTQAPLPPPLLQTSLSNDSSFETLTTTSFKSYQPLAAQFLVNHLPKHSHSAFLNLANYIHKLTRNTYVGIVPYGLWGIWGLQYHLWFWGINVIVWHNSVVVNDGLTYSLRPTKDVSSSSKFGCI